MKVNLEKQGKNVIQLGVELEPEKAMRAYEMACRQLSHKVNIPGFRKGKAPRNIIEKTLGVDYIKREALEDLVPRLLNTAILDENLDVITEPEIESCKFELGEPLTLTARFEVRPEVVLGQYQGVSVEVSQAELPADAMDRALANVAESKSSLQSVADRPVKVGDTVVLDFECYVNDKLVEGGKAQGLILEVREGNFLEGFCEQLVDKEPGKQFEVKVRFPDEYRNRELAGNDALFKVEIKGIRERFVPPVDDELAESVGQNSLAALKELIQARLDDELAAENESRAQRAVVDAVIASAQVDIPETMIDREHELLMRQVRRMVEQNEQSWEDFEQSPEFAAVNESKRAEASQRVLTSLVLGAIVRAEKISVEDQEMVPYLNEIARRYDVPIERVARDQEVRRQVMEEILTQKVVQFLVSQAQIKFVPENQIVQEQTAASEGKAKQAAAAAESKEG
ncbi:MAG TPA: trigger factor [Candidatus Obscuribacterales bacterium]